MSSDPSAVTSGATIAVIDYGIGNLRSAHKALEHVGGNVTLVSDADAVARADAVVLPGVGSFGPTMAAISALGFDQAITDFIDSGRPFLGICVGMQVLYQGSDESPHVDGLGILHGVVTRLPNTVKIPQMQWNQVERCDTGNGRATATSDEGSVLLEGLGERPWFYFVHSYASDVSAETTATCDYGRRFSASVRAGNVFATQFHPEKSGDAGLRLLTNFVRFVDRQA